MDEPMHPGQVLLERALAQGRSAPLFTDHEIIFVDQYFRKLKKRSEQNGNVIRLHYELFSLLPEHIQSQIKDFICAQNEREDKEIEDLKELISQAKAKRNSLETAKRTPREGD